jgi:hypothetical protein
MATAVEKVGGDVKALFGLAMFLTIGATLIDSGALGWMVAFPVLGMLVYCMTQVPLRYPLFVLAFCAVTLENPNETPAYGQWQSPLHRLGALLLMHLNNTLGPRWMFFSGMDLMLGTLVLVALYRKYTRSPVDRIGHLPTPKPLIQLAFVSFAGTAFVWIYGLMRGGENGWALWQIDRVVYLPLVFLLFQFGLRGPKDIGALAKVLVSAAILKAFVAMYVTYTVQLPPDPYTGDTRLPYATTHHDSMLFADAVAMLVALILERCGKKYVRWALIILPILFIGMWANNRRLVWVEVAIVFVTTYFLTPPNPAKRFIKRAMYFIIPVLIGYLAAGWESKSPVFKPVQVIRSVVDPQTDASSMWRELENYNLVSTIRGQPIMGMGYGHPFWEIVPLPEIAYPLERYCPHNSILGLWAYAGYFGYTAMTMLWVVGVYFGIRAYLAAKAPLQKAAALTCFGAVCVYLVHCFGDLGLGMWTGVWTVGPALALAGKLAVANGQWGPQTPAPAPGPPETGTQGPTTAAISFQGRPGT